MVTDVSTALQLDPMFQPPSPFTVCAPSNSCDISLGDLSLPFPELFDDSVCFDDALKNAGEMLIDPEIYHGACADMERVFAEMSSGKRPIDTGEDDDGGRGAKKAKLTPEKAKQRSSKASSSSKGKAHKRALKQRVGSSAGASTSAAAAGASVAAAALSAARRPTATSTGPIDTATGRADVSEQSSTSGEFVVTPPETVAEKLNTDDPLWKPVRDRSYILSDDDLNLIWFCGSNRVSAGNAVTPDYIVAGLQIGSWEEQQIVNGWFREKKLEIMHPTDPTLSAGAVCYEFNVKGLRSLSTFPPNCDFPPRTYCFACKNYASRNELHCFCCGCCVRGTGPLCPLTELCKNCILMNWTDLKARYNNMLGAIRDYAAGEPPPSRTLPHRMTCQYDCNVQMLSDFRKSDKKKLPPYAVRPALSLETLRPPAAQEVPIPRIADESPPGESASPTPYRYGRRGTKKERRTLAAEKKMLESLPAIEGQGRYLTLTEVKSYHEDNHKVMGQPARVMPEAQKAENIRNYQRSQYCRREFPSNPDDVFYGPWLRVAPEPRKKVTVSFASAENMQHNDNASVSFVPVDDGPKRVQMYRRTAENCIIRDDIRDVRPHYAHHWARAPRRRIYNVITQREQVPHNETHEWWNFLLDKYTWWNPRGPYQPRVQLLSKHAVPLPEEPSGASDEQVEAAGLQVITTIAGEPAVDSSSVDAVLTASTSSESGVAAHHDVTGQPVVVTEASTVMSIDPIDSAAANESSAALPPEQLLFVQDDSGGISDIEIDDDEGLVQSLEPAQDPINDILTSPTLVSEFLHENNVFIEMSSRPTPQVSVPLGGHGGDGAAVYDATAMTLNTVMAMAPPVSPDMGRCVQVTSAVDLIAPATDVVLLTAPSTSKTSAPAMSMALTTATSTVTTTAVGATADPETPTTTEATSSMGIDSPPVATTAAVSVTVQEAPAAMIAPPGPALDAAAGGDAIQPKVEAPADDAVVQPSGPDHGQGDDAIELPIDMSTGPTDNTVRPGIQAAASADGQSGAVVEPAHDVPVAELGIPVAELGPSETNISEVECVLTSPLGAALDTYLWNATPDMIDSLSLLAAIVVLDTRAFQARRHGAEKVAIGITLVAREVRLRTPQPVIDDGYDVPGEWIAARGMLGTEKHEQRPHNWTHRDALIVSVTMEREYNKGSDLTKRERAELLVWAWSMHHENVPSALKLAQGNLLRALARDEPNPRTFGRAATFATGPEVLANPMEMFWAAVVGPPEDRLLPPSGSAPGVGPEGVSAVSLSRRYAPHARSSYISDSEESYATAYTADTFDTAITSLPRLLDIAVLNTPDRTSLAPSSLPSRDGTPHRPTVMPTLVPDVPISQRVESLDLAIPLKKTRELAQFYKISIDVAAWRAERNMPHAPEEPPAAE